MTKERPTPTRSKRGRPPLGRPTKSQAASFRASPAFKEWMDDLLLHCRIRRTAKDLSDLIERGLVLVARAEGFAKEPPVR